MRFKLDENLGTRGLKELREAGYDVMTVREQQLCGHPDSQVIDICTAEKRCLITLDTDFADTLTYPPEKYAGIVSEAIWRLQCLKIRRLTELRDSGSFWCLERERGVARAKQCLPI